MQILQYGRVMRPSLGIVIAPPQALQRIGEKGVLVLDVSPAVMCPQERVACSALQQWRWSGGSAAAQYSHDIRPSKPSFLHTLCVAENTTEQVEHSVVRCLLCCEALRVVYRILSNIAVNRLVEQLKWQPDLGLISPVPFCTLPLASPSPVSHLYDPSHSLMGAYECAVYGLLVHAPMFDCLCALVLNGWVTQTSPAGH